MAMTNMLVIEAAITALKGDTFYEFSVATNMQAKQMTYRTLSDLNLQFIPSPNIFVFFKSGPHIDALSAAMAIE